ncbi:MAG: zinc-finger domain-containing protein [Rhodospirillaceae bacterium]|nr:zinc-finger domain-containing protein [Rhodospirillaceae bacterium]
MLDDTETTLVPDRNVVCDGGDVSLGHPRVHLKIGHSQEITCPYCGRCYKLSQDG